MTKPRYWVVIPAAGTGQRMQSKIPKQYLQINNQTIIERTVSIFTHYKNIELVVVALHHNDTQWSTINIEHPDKVVTTVGGATRAHSVMRGLQYLQTKAAPQDWVLVHDAARPCLSAAVLDRLIKTIADHPVGGLLALPITDTVKKVDADHCVLNTLSRDNLWMAQTPQMFRYDLLFKAMTQALDSGAAITDESSAVELLGECPLIVEGDWRNIKITQPHDLERVH